MQNQNYSENPTNDLKSGGNDETAQVTKAWQTTTSSGITSLQKEAQTQINKPISSNLYKDHVIFIN